MLILGFFGDQDNQEKRGGPKKKGTRHPAVEPEKKGP